MPGGAYALHRGEEAAPVDLQEDGFEEFGSGEGFSHGLGLWKNLVIVVFDYLADAGCDFPVALMILRGLLIPSCRFWICGQWGEIDRGGITL